MAYKLAIGDVIDFPVTLKVRDVGEIKTFKFFVQAERIDADESRQLMTKGTTLGEQSIDDFLKSKIKGWSGQRLVLEEDGKTAAPYSPEAFSALAAIPGASMEIYAAYLGAISANSGEAGARKN